MIAHIDNSSTTATLAFTSLRSDGLHLMPELNDGAAATATKFDMPHRQMRPSGAHLRLEQDFKNSKSHKVDDTMSCDTVSTSSLSCSCSDDDASTVDDCRIPACISVHTSSANFSTSTNTTSSTRTWEDRAIGMERMVAADLSGKVCGTSMGRSSYKPIRRSLQRDAASWIKN